MLPTWGFPGPLLFSVVLNIQWNSTGTISETFFDDFRWCKKYTTVFPTSPRIYLPPVLPQLWTIHLHRVVPDTDIAQSTENIPFPHQASTTTTQESSDPAAKDHQPVRACRLTCKGSKPERIATIAVARSIATLCSLAYHVRPADLLTANDSTPSVR